MRGLLATLLAVGLLLSSGGPTRAARSPEANQLYEQARSAMKEGDPAAALDRFERLLELVEGDERETWQMLLGVALAHEHLGHMTSAIEAYRRFLGRSEAHPSVMDDAWRARRDLTAEKIAVLEQEVLLERGLISVSSTPSGARLLVDGEPVGLHGAATTPFAAYLKPGRHTLRLELEGHQPVELVVRAVVGQREPFAVSLTVRSQPPEPASTVPAPAAEEAPGAPWPAWGFVAGGGGLLVGGSVAFGLAVADRDEQASLDPAAGEEAFTARHATLTERMQLKEAVAWSLWGVGAAAIIGGVVWVLLDRGGEAGASVEGSSWYVVPKAGGARAGVTWTF